jgi:hypothetical protein
MSVASLGTSRFPKEILADTQIYNSLECFCHIYIQIRDRELLQIESQETLTELVIGRRNWWKDNE